jgi:cytochrome c oxidase cbb3-type subunit III
MILWMAVLASYPSLAQNAQATTSSTSTANYVEYLVLFVALLLVAAIWVLASVLMLLSKKVVEIAKQNKTGTMLFLMLAAGIANPAFAQEASTATTNSIEASSIIINYGGLSAISFWTITIVLSIELLIVFVMLYFIRSLLRIINPAPAKLVIEGVKAPSWIQTTWANLDKKFFTQAKPIEQEADIMLDHNYDGIKELDNALPPWWKYGFYITIFVAIFYILKFEVWHTGMNPTEEYNAEMVEAKIETDTYLASMKENVDETSVVMLDAAGIASGKILFTKTCVACHTATGAGGVGPNLTDNYTIHGAAIKDIFKTIKYGYPDKGMQSWQSNFSPIEMQALASYVKSLSNTNVAGGKAPQGDLIPEEATMISTDSTNSNSLKK